MPNSKFVKVGKVGKSEGKTTAEVVIRDDAVDKDFTLKASMTKTGGVWKADRIVNFREYMTEYEKAKEEKIASLNEEIAEKIAKTAEVSVGALNKKTGEGWNLWCDATLLCPVTVKNISNSEILEYKVILTISDEAGNALLEYEDIWGSGPRKIGAGQEVAFNIPISLRKGREDEKSVIDTPTDKLKASARIKSMKTATENLAPLRDLPKPKEEK